MSGKHLEVVRKRLKNYADRGLFQDFDEMPARNGKRSFKFTWLGRRPLTVTVDTDKGSLRFNDVFPNVASRSHLDIELRAFLLGRKDTSLPAHRRIDVKRAEVAYSNRRGNISIELTVKNNQYAYGIRKLVNLVHEMWVELSASHADYLFENFGAPQE
jgi:hypothetical protein